MTKDEAEKCLREIAKYGCIQPSKHCRERMQERQINMDDILYVLLWGNVIGIEYNKDHHSWQCKVRGKDIDGESLVFVAGIYEDCQAVRCITVY
ncbi:MAG: DUF4258 domain-containing protein [Desulfobacula sp.]|jgi:hypothetical protein|nr:DUF4258 domain-containing protein [Desulfobacula sp.]